jgi:hypothetical protein
MFNFFTSIRTSVVFFGHAFLHFIPVLLPWIPEFRTAAELLVVSLQLLIAQANDPFI